MSIELTNKGHQFGYENFNNKQINSLIRLCKNLKKKYNLKKRTFRSLDIAPLRKNDPGEKFEKIGAHNLGCWYSTKKYKFKNKSNALIKILFLKIFINWDIDILTSKEET